MQEAVSDKTWSPLHPQPKRAKNNLNLNLNISIFTERQVELDVITKMVSDNAAIVFSRPGCCMCHVVKLLLQGLGTNPVVHEVEDDNLWYFNGYFEENGKANEGFQFPAVFIGGKLYGGLDRVIATHISGELVPILKQAGALWL